MISEISENNQNSVISSQRWSQLIQEYSRAEKAIKEFDLVDGNLCFPAVNQLRYAGYHILKCISCDRGAENDAYEQYYKALNHAKRAYYDARECLLISLINKVKDISELLGPFTFLLEKYIPNYSKKKSALIKADNKFKRLCRIRFDDRDSFFNSCDDSIQIFRDYVASFEKVKDAVLKEKFELECNKGSSNYEGINNNVPVESELERIASTSVTKIGEFLKKQNSSYSFYISIVAVLVTILNFGYIIYNDFCKGDLRDIVPPKLDSIELHTSHIHQILEGNKLLIWLFANLGVGNFN